MPEALEAFFDGVSKSPSIEQLIVHCTNMSSCVGSLVQVFKHSRSLQELDLQVNGLSDKNAANHLSKVISLQFELKDSLKWKLGLRQESEVNLDTMGLKKVNFSKNWLGEKSAAQFANTIRQDNYLRSLELQQN